MAWFARKHDYSRYDVVYVRAQHPNLAFGLIIGSVAVAVALAFGLGGREAAGKQVERWFETLRTKRAEETIEQRSHAQGQAQRSLSPGD